MDVPKKRGLSALLAATTPHPAAQAAAAGTGEAALPNPVMTGDVPITSIRPNPKQPRTDFDPQALAELAASIKVRGLIQPVVVRQLRPEEIAGDTRYELIAGERRWRASQMAGLTNVQAVIKQVFDEREILLLSLVENLQRDDLNPIEEAIAYDRLGKMFNLTHEQIAEGVGKSRVQITNMIRILDLPTSVQDALKAKKLNVGHAKVLLSIPDPKIQAQLAAKTQAEGLTVRELERLIVGAQAEHVGVPQRVGPDGNAIPGRGNKIVPPHIQDIERRLREHFGTKVIVEESLRKGRIIIEFYSVEDFSRIAYLMGIDAEQQEAEPDVE
jgi:ParB family chromosome partitioning protein